MYYQSTVFVLVAFICFGVYHFMLRDGHDLVYLFSSYLDKYAPNIDGQEFDNTEYPWRKMLRDNFEAIKSEFLEYKSRNTLHRLSDIDNSHIWLDTAINKDIPWDVLMLRVFYWDTMKMQYFPVTSSLIRNIPGCTFAMFSLMHAKKSLPLHKGFYKGVMRYHLTLISPKHYRNSFIIVNGKKHYWRVGEDVMFDDTYEHQVFNLSRNETRVILLLDIKRNFSSFLANALNTIFLNIAKHHETVVNIVNNQDRM